MIPIECPKCGRGGSVPPDRLNARLVCKACHQVFHLDNTGRIMMGDPQSPDKKQSKPKPAAASSSGMADFDLAQTWNDIPKPVKFGVPGVLLAVLGWIYLGPGGGDATAHLDKGESIIRAVIDNNKSRVVSSATSDSADAAGQWFDLVHTELAKGTVDPTASITPGLLSGDAEKDPVVVLMAVILRTGAVSTPLTVVLPLKRDGSSWKFDATQGLEQANKSLNPTTRAAGKR